MKLKSLNMELFVPIGTTFAVVVIGFAWFFVATQNDRSESAFDEQLTTLAATSRIMIHSAAEEYTQARGMQFHRVPIESGSAQSGRPGVERRAMETLLNDANLESYREIVDHDTAQWMHVFAPARLQPECHTCHDAYGIDMFKDRKDGEIVALFGVSGSLESLYAEERQMLYLVIAAVFCVLFLVRWVIGRTLKTAVVAVVGELATQSDHVANGDLRHMETPELERRMNSQDEVGTLVRSFAGMITGLRQLIGQLGTAASSVAESGTTISSTTEELAAGALEQSSQVNEVASAVEQMARTIIENSKNATKAAETAKMARESAERGGGVVRETVSGMKRIAEVVNSSAVTVQTLGHSSDQIGEIIGVIEDIADQTNLLALNAAIEAARAGEQGRGFAVVADEVRKLAERTTKATREIGTMIKKIQSDTSGAVKSMEEGTQEVERGIALADKAGSALNEIVEISANVTDVISQIAAASEEQSTAAEQISKNIEAINTVSQEAANGTQQIARAADDLRQLTEQLQSIVGQFQISEDGDAPISSRGQHNAPTQRAELPSVPKSNHDRPPLRLQARTPKSTDLFVWKPDFSVGIGSIDEQHKQLVSFINTLHDAMRAGSGNAAIEPILAELIEYTKYHFGHEEEIFRATAYGDSATHKLEHDKLTRQVVEIERSIHAGKTVLTMEVMDFLKQWLMNHILIRDKAYSAHMQSHGVR